MSDVNCPYCGQEVEINHDDGYGYAEDETYQQDCDKCDKTFVYTTAILFIHEASKADCLNGGEHEWKASCTYPKECTCMVCSMCDKRRKPTAEEMKKILTPAQPEKGEQ